MTSAVHSRVLAAGTCGLLAVAWLLPHGAAVDAPVPLAELAAAVPVIAEGQGVLPASGREVVADVAGHAAAPGEAERRFVASAQTVLAAPGAADGKLAVLRAAPAAVPAAWCALYARAVVEPRCREAVPVGDTPAEFALQRLVRACASEPAARAALADVVFGAAAVPDDLRQRAARAYAATVPIHEQLDLAARAEAVVEPGLRASLQAGLALAAEK